MKFRREIQNKIDEIKGKLIKLAGLIEKTNQNKLKLGSITNSGVARSKANKKRHSQTSV
jgi:hypothetical protein